MCQKTPMFFKLYMEIEFAKSTNYDAIKNKIAEKQSRKILYCQTIKLIVLSSIVHIYCII